MRRALFLIIVGTLVLGCSSQEKRFNHALENGDCVAALENIPETKDSKKVISEIRQGAGTGASYFLTGLTYGSEFVIKVVGGLGIGLVICSPIIAVEAAAGGSSGHASGQCWGEVSSHTLGFAFNGKSWGKSVHRGTKAMRCPILDNISESMRRVAACYQEKGSPSDKEKARKQLQVISRDSTLQRCLSDEEKLKVKEAIKGVG